VEKYNSKILLNIDILFSGKWLAKLKINGVIVELALG
jgi:hypothetical protein